MGKLNNENLPTENEHNPDKSSTPGPLQPEVLIGSTDKEVTVEAAKQSKKLSVKNWLNRHRKIVISLSAIMLIAITLLAVIEPARLTVLNLFVSKDAEILVVDRKTKQAIQGASITIEGYDLEAITNDEGVAVFNGLKLGNATITIAKDAYEQQNTEYKIGIGDNVVGPIELLPIGIPVTIRAFNYINEEPVKSFMVTIKDKNISAKASEDGAAVINLPPEDGKKVQAIITTDGFNEITEEILINNEIMDVNVTLVPSGKHYFVSTQSGSIDVYSSNLDGSGKSLIIKGSGKETEDVQFIISGNNKFAAMVSTREGIKDPSGRYRPALYIIDFEQKNIERVDDGTQYFTLYGWSGDYIVYKTQGDSFENNDNSKIKSYNTQTKKLTTYISDSYLGITSMIKDHIYVNLDDQNKEQYGLYEININDQNIKQLTKAPVSGLEAISPSSLAYNKDGDWFKYTINGDVQSISSKPLNLKLGDFVYSPSQDRAAWVEERDGKGVIIIGDSNGNDKTSINNSIDATNILSWEKDGYVIARVSNSDETADYIVDLATGKSKKISNIYNYNYSFGRGY